MSRLKRYLQGLVALITASFFIYYFVSINRNYPRVNDIEPTSIDVDYTKRQLETKVVRADAGTGSERRSSLINWRNLTREQVGKLSVLGKWLLSPEGTEPPKPRDADTSREYLILIWKYGPMLERRHLKHFTSETFSPWDGCSVKNCRISYDAADVDNADAVLFHLHQTKGVNELPKDVKFENRMKQRWVFLTDESPHHTFLGGGQSMANYNGIFNWSMSYRMDSDVPVPYGRTILKRGGGSPVGDTETVGKSKLVAVLGSNCGGNNHRWDYVKKLEDSLRERLDIFGHCLNGDTQSCPGHFTSDCKAINDYKFYLSFENSNCREYFTEKVFWNAYEKNSVPVIMGAPRDDCGRYLPPKSYIHTDDFANPNTLADYLVYLDKTDVEYMKFHEWRKDFKVLNEHAYFKSNSRHYCRLCEALNYNEPNIKVYEDLDAFWNPKTDCR